MTERFVAVLSLPEAGNAAPPGVDPDRFRLALLEDTYELAADMGRVTAALALPPGEESGVAAVTWPGTPVLHLSTEVRSDGSGAGPDGTPASASPEALAAVLAGLSDLGADEGVVLAGDAPDLPIMLLGKLFQALEDRDAAACPAERGGLVGFGCRLPVPDWLPGARVALDSRDALRRLRQAAPSRRSVSITPGWRRLRRPDDVANLDPGLEGWETTRALLSGHPRA